MPSIIPTRKMPVGLDSLELKLAHKHCVDARIAQRIRKLSALPGTTVKPVAQGGDAQGKEGDKEGKVGVHPSSTAHGKRCTVIELKGLQLRARQQALCRTV